MAPQRVQSFVKVDPGTTSPAQTVASYPLPWPLALKSPSSPAADGTEQRLRKSNPTPNPVFTIIIDRSVIASDTTVKVSALQPWLRRTGLRSGGQEYL